VRVGLILFRQNHIEENLYIGKSMSDGKQKITPEIGQIFQRYRKKRLNPATGRTWTLEDLGKEVSKIIQKFYGSQEEGLSFSAISRLENGSLLPSKAKLKILAEFLEIPESELKPYIQLKSVDLNLSHAPQNESLKIRELALRENKGFLDWLRLLSYCNIAADYSNTLEFAEEALLEIEAAPVSVLNNIMRYLIQSKKAYAQYMLNPKHNAYLNRSREWASRAEQLWSGSALKDSEKGQDLWTVSILRIETLRCLLTASLEHFNAEFVAAPRLTTKAKDALHVEHAELFALVSQIEKKLNPQEWESGFTAVQKQELLELYLYFRREKDRFNYKWLEAVEMYALCEYATAPATFETASVVQNLEEIPLLVVKQLLQTISAPQAQTFMAGLFVIQGPEILFSPALLQQPAWHKLQQSMADTLALHDLLDEPDPNKGYQEAILLYPVTAVRIGQFSELMDLAYFKLIYMLTTPLTRSTWYYVRACCYALWFRHTQAKAHLQLSVANWAKYCQVSPYNGQEYNRERFAHLLGEAALWSTYFPLLVSPSENPPLVSWLSEALKTLLKDNGIP